MKTSFLILVPSIVLTGLFALPAASLAPPLDHNDWRQLWPENVGKVWDGKSDSELRRLANNGHAAAQFVLSKRWRRTRKDEAQGLLESAANAGLPQAMYAKGSSLFLVYTSSDVLRNEGWSLMERAAASGFPPAKLGIAEYEAGFVIAGESTRGLPFVKPNLARAVDYLRDSVAIQNRRGLRQLAILYSSGIGEPRDESESPHNLLVRAAKLGDADAMLLLSERYVTGHGETVDLFEAARWRVLARKEGSTNIEDSFLVDDNLNPKAQDTTRREEFAQVFSLYLKVNERQDPDSALELAKLFRRHGRVSQSITLLNTAIRQGNNSAARELDALKAGLSPDQQTVGDGSEWKP